MLPRARAPARSAIVQQSVNHIRHPSLCPLRSKPPTRSARQQGSKSKVNPYRTGVILHLPNPRPRLSKRQANCSRPLPARRHRPLVLRTRQHNGPSYHLTPSLLSTVDSLIVGITRFGDTHYTVPRGRVASLPAPPYLPLACTRYASHPAHPRPRQS